MITFFGILARYSRVILYGAWFFALIALIDDRQHEVFLRPEFRWLLVLAALAIIAFILVEANRLDRKMDISYAAVMRWFVLAAPLVYLPLASNVVLDSRTFRNRWTGFSENAPTAQPQTLADQAKAAVSNGIYAVTLSELSWRAEFYSGQKITVDGKIKRLPEITEEFGADACLLYRFRITCCVADAIPIAILLKGDIPPEWENDTWVRAQGLFTLESGGQRDIVRLDLDKATTIPAPQNPYLF